MMFLEKLIRAAESRPSRFHTQAGEFYGWREFQNRLENPQSSPSPCPSICSTTSPLVEPLS